MFLPSLGADGFTIVDEVLDPALREALLVAFEGLGEGPAGRRAGHRVGLAHEAVRALARSARVRALVDPVLGPGAFAHRATLFDKTPDANWLVAWHQDLVVPVQKRHETAGFGPWSSKADGWHVQPPLSVLEQLLAIRIDLDGSDLANGALRVLPATQTLGVLRPERIAELAQTVSPVTCCVPPGGALCLRPLLVHASSRATQPRHRRIVHLEFSANELPGGLAFAQNVQ